MPAQLLILGNPGRKRRMAAARTRAEKLRGRKKNPAELLVLGAGNPKLRRNGAAEDLYEGFQEREPGSLGEPPLLEYDETQRMPRMSAVLGDLRAIGFSNISKKTDEPLHGEALANRWMETYQHLSFAKSDAKLADNGTRTQLYVVGGDQEMGNDAFDYLGVRRSGSRPRLGAAVFIVYDTIKGQDNFTSVLCHEFAEEDGRRPTIYYDEKAQRILIRGGSYVIEDRGIVN
jgi:hypothetical protein